MDIKDRSAFVDSAFQGAADALVQVNAGLPAEMADAIIRQADAWIRLGMAAATHGVPSTV